MIAPAFFLAAAGSHLRAQDLRSVKEPAIPPACVALKATLTPGSATSGEIEASAGKAGSDDPALDTARLQHAIDECDRGHAVELAADGANSAFLIGPIFLRPGVALLIDKGVTLYATRNPEFYAVTPGSCGMVNDNSANGCKSLIAIKGATGSAIMGDGTIDGQGGAAMITDGKPSSYSWWDLGDQARTTGHEQSPGLIEADVSDDVTLYRVTLRNSPNFHASFRRGAGFTVWAVRIDTPKSARNTVGIDLAQAKNITIAQSYIRAGDDDIGVSAANGPATNITIAHNHFYWGHGLTIGSQTSAGVSGIRVDDLSLDSPDNGIRITSNPAHGGLVEDVTYRDVCIRNAKYPIVFDTAFSFPGKGVEVVPVYQDITLSDVRISGGGKVQFNGFDHTRRIGVTLDGVSALDGPEKYKAQANHTDLTFGTSPVNFVFTGDDSTVTGKQVDGKLPGCAEKFVPFP